MTENIEVSLGHIVIRQMLWKIISDDARSRLSNLGRKSEFFAVISWSTSRIILYSVVKR